MGNPYLYCLPADAYLTWSTIVLITIMHFEMILLCSFQEWSFKEMHSALFFSNQEMKQTFCLFYFFPNLLSVDKKNENGLKHVSISSKCTKHIQADDIKVFCGYLKHVVVVCLQSNFMFLSGRLLGSCSLSSIRLENNY